MQAGLRDVVSLPLSLEQLEGSVRAAAQWSRTLRERVAGEESAAGALGGRLIAVAGAKGGVGTTTVALQLALAAIRALPGRPVCVVDFDLQKGDLRAFLDLPHRRSVVDLVEVAAEISVRHLQETLYTHNEGFRVLLAPEEGERGEEIDSGVARAVLNAVKARHALTVVDLGAAGLRGERDRRRDRQQRRDRHDARRRRRCAACGACATSGGGSRCASDEDVRVVLNRASRKLEIQPDLARKVVGPTLAQTTIPDDFGAFETAVNTGSPVRVEDGKLRGAFDALAAELGVLPGAEEPEAEGGEGRGLLARLGGERGQATAETMGLLPVLILFVLALWQLGLVGYTYVLAGHAAREGARMLAVNPTDGKPDGRGVQEGPHARDGRGAEGVARRRRVRGPGGRGRRSRCGSRCRSCVPGLKLAVRDRLARRDGGRGRGRCRRRQAITPEPVVVTRLCATQRGQASAEFMGMVFWLLLAALFSGS